MHGTTDPKEFPSPTKPLPSPPGTPGSLVGVSGGRLVLGSLESLKRGWWCCAGGGLVSLRSLGSLGGGWCCWESPVFLGSLGSCCWGSWCSWGSCVGGGAAGRELVSCTVASSLHLVKCLSWVHSLGVSYFPRSEYFEESTFLRVITLRRALFEGWAL